MVIVLLNSSWFTCKIVGILTKLSVVVSVVEQSIFDSVLSVSSFSDEFCLLWNEDFNRFWRYWRHVLVKTQLIFVYYKLNYIKNLTMNWFDESLFNSPVNRR